MYTGTSVTAHRNLTYVFFPYFPEIFLCLVLLTVIELVNTTVPCNQSCTKTIHKGVKLSKFMKRNTAELLKTYVSKFSVLSLKPLKHINVQIFR